jgi:hypothetical protein
MPRKATAKKAEVDQIGDPASEELVETKAPEEPVQGEEEVKTQERPVGPQTVEELVNDLILTVRGMGAKVDRSRMLAVVDLASRYVAAGQEFRQLFVQATDLAVTISLVETLKSNYGGSASPKTLASFQVPSTKTECYDRINQRFFGFKPEKNLKDGEYLLTLLKTTKTA